MAGVILVEAEPVDEEIGGSVEEYRAYLEERGEGEVVGSPEDEADRPVRHFLVWRHGEEEIYVEAYLVFGGQKVYDSQRWIDFHVRHVDREEGAITAGRALSLLRVASEAERAEAERVESAGAGGRV